MKRSKLITLFAMVAAMVLATAASAYAGAPGGTVYGQATMQPTVSIVLGGAGSDSGWPLVYSATAGEWAPEADWDRVTVTNNGDVNVPLSLGYGSDPTDGENTWYFANSVDDTHCMWEFMSGPPLFGGARVPDSMGSPNLLSPEPLLVGDSVQLDTFFTFPTSYDGTPHTMTALIIADVF
ncbi:MAG: hypothetical protein CVT67_02750 [Actinobacteria bacterium HGW-Actinobacteria-7]|nr:MAG: hypothetical protein CVT67_02750 [Actinobacteria bacterium HGW-Actinobacteria-7]